MNRTFYLIAFVLVFGIGMLVPAVACKCGEHPVLDKQQCDLYNVIFKGKVDSISGCRDGYATAYFRIQELYKGKSLEQVSVRFDCESDCQLSVGNGEEWLVYARYFQYNKLDMEFCSRSRKHIEGADDFYTALNHMSWKEEGDVLVKIIGKQQVTKKVEPPMKERTLIQPSAYWKIGLVLISVVAMLIIFYLVKKIP
ncbi:MAG TPA: hypothetical protein VNZ86_17640 [Bacteroidia bacterium]|jgi:hypothetical protein|nr:hypothetical protein [Bacteroidia bacterium]